MNKLQHYLIQNYAALSTKINRKYNLEGSEVIADLYLSFSNTTTVPDNVKAYVWRSITHYRANYHRTARYQEMLNDKQQRELSVEIAPPPMKKLIRRYEQSLGPEATKIHNLLKHGYTFADAATALHKNYDTTKAIYRASIIKFREKEAINLKQ